jgi:GntR family transcriptional regulator of vanillate catabolism
MPSVNNSRKTSRKNGSASSQFEHALVSLREMILHGDFASGQRLRTVSLAERLGVSRTPIRLALERLEQEGILETTPGGSFRVCEFSVQDIWDAVEARGALEGTAARMAAERLEGSSELDPLWRLNEKLDKFVRSGPLLHRDAEGSSDQRLAAVNGYAELNQELHLAIVKLAKSRMLKWALDRVQTIPFVRPSAAIIPPSSRTILTLALEQHQSILEAIGNREAARAEDLATEHARLVRRNLELALKAGAESAHAAPALSLVRE